MAPSLPGWRWSILSGISVRDSDLACEGRTWVRGAISAASLAAMDSGFNTLGNAGARFTLSHARPLLREVTMIAGEIMPGAEPVRVVAFDKNAAENWTLPWHQDRVVALKERVEAPGFSNWTHKSGIWHAEPPIEFLDRMIFARIHLDPADENNGCLQLALGTHAHGKVASSDAEAASGSTVIENCVAERGDILFSKALILHRSSPSRASAGRRAIRVDYCAERLPPPLQWAE